MAQSVQDAHVQQLRDQGTHLAAGAMRGVTRGTVPGQVGPHNAFPRFNILDSSQAVRMLPSCLNRHVLTHPQPLG